MLIQWALERSPSFDLEFDLEGQVAQPWNELCEARTLDGESFETTFGAI